VREPVRRRLRRAGRRRRARDPDRRAGQESLSEPTRAEVEAALAAAGCVAPGAEAGELSRAASEGVGPIEELLARRVAGEPLPWVTASTTFCGLRIQVDRGVFVPRPHSEPLARRSAELLPDAGVAVDLCTGTGAIAAVLARERPNATIVATDIDPASVACARRNGVDARPGDLDEPLPASLARAVDVIAAVPPYVPTEELHLLPRDVRAHEPELALDGGPGGTRLLVRAAEAAARWLRPGGWVLLELGGEQAAAMTRVLQELGFEDVGVLRDEEGQDRAIEGRFAPTRSTA
jgi:release factor glutamine methyltransferase